MSYSNTTKRPSKKVQITALQSYRMLAAELNELQSDTPEIEIEETKEKIKIPLEAMKLFAEILKAMSQGKPISIVPIETEMTTQAAAVYLGCSRPFMVKLLEEGKIPFIKVGRHRRVKFEDMIRYKAEMKKQQEEAIIRMMRSDEESGLYDS